MKCVLCGNFFYFKRNLLELFKEKEEYICPKCYKKYPITLNILPIQLEKYDCVIVSMFSKKYYIEYNAFIKEYGQVFKANLKRKGFKLLFFNHLVLDEYTLEGLDAISKMLKSSIIVVLFSVS